MCIGKKIRHFEMSCDFPELIRDHRRSFQRALGKGKYSLLARNSAHVVLRTVFGLHICYGFFRSSMNFLVLQTVGRLDF